jgi:hypothetical protein
MEDFLAAVEGLKETGLSRGEDIREEGMYCASAKGKQVRTPTAKRNELRFNDTSKVGTWILVSGPLTCVNPISSKTSMSVRTHHG